MEKIEDKIRNNLYDFYDQIAKTNGIFSEKQAHWSVVRNNTMVWPRIIYRLDSEIIEGRSSTQFSEKVNFGIYPEVLIVGDEDIQQIDPFLREHGFFPFSAWKGMAIRNQEYISPPNLPATIQIVRPESSKDIEQWLEIVSVELLHPYQSDETLLKNLIDIPGFEAFLLKNNGIGVSTILVFNAEDSTGLYFIATEKSAQRHGFGKLLVHQILSQCAKKPIVLHATQKGEALYTKLGFQPFNQFFLYRYLNTNL